jgi:uroporphyrinogen III methyltransferase/synthase
LDEVGARIAEHHIRPPAIVIIGAVAQIDDGLAWFERRPLFGASVLVTRPRGQAESLAARLRALGADVGVEPAIDVAPTDDWSDVDRALERIGQFNWIVFSSTNGVDSGLERLRYLGKDWRAMGEVKIAAVGPATAARLAERDLRADHVPETFQADRLADDLAADANGRRFLLIRASRGREVLAERLTAAGGSVEQVVTYRSEDAPPVAADAIEAVRRGRWQWVTVTSPAIGRSLVQQDGDALAAAKLASISPVTSEALVGLGRPPACTAREATMPGVVDAIVAHRAENPE